MDSRFAQKMSRGAMGDPNQYVTAQQEAVLKKYVPTTKWSKDERIVYVTMQNYIDRTGVAPTVGQIAAMAQQVSLDEKVALTSGLTAQRVQRALNKLSKRGIVFEM
jgi:hypothetical protein